MAGEIFVGSVSVGVVPDLRGFNDRLRAELVPSANLIGREIGREMSRGMMDELNMGRIIAEATTKAQVVARKSGYELGLNYGRAFRRGFDLALEGWHPKVTVEVDADTLAARVAIARLSGTVTERVRTTGGGSALDALIPGGSARGGRGGRNDPGVIGGIGALIRAFPGGTSGSLGAVPASVGVPAAIAGAIALPFIGQVLSGGVVSALGAGLAGLGIAGAAGAGQTPQTEVTRLKGVYDAAAARVIADQTRLNALRASGKASAQQLTSAEATLAGARTSAATAQQKYQDAERSRMTSGQEAVQKAFKDLAFNAKQDLASIGESFVPVLQGIAHAAEDTLGKLTPVFKTAVDTISGPFEVFSETIIKTFASPQVKSSIQAVATAFSDILTAFTPDIPGIINSFADAIERIAQAISKNPKAFADFLNFVFQLGIAILNTIAFLTDFADWIESHWSVIWEGMVRAATQAVGPVVVAATRIVTYITQHWRELAHNTAVWFDRIRHGIAEQWNLIYHDTIGNVIRLHQWIQTQLNKLFHNVADTYDHIRHWIANAWDTIYRNTVGKVIQLHQWIQRQLDRLFHNIADTYDHIRHDIAHIWDVIWNNTISRLIRGYHDVLDWFHRLKTSVVNWFHDAVNWLVNSGRDIITGLWNGIKNIWSTVSTWFSQMGGRIKGWFVNAVNWLWDAGRNVIGGLLNGIKNAMLGIGGWVKRVVVDPVVNAVKHFFGIHSPSSLMFGLGASITMGLLHGVLSLTGHIGGAINKMFGGWPQALGHIVNKGIIAIAKLPAKALHALGTVAGKVGGFVASAFRGGPAGSGVERWASVVKVALMLNNMPDSFAGQVLYQMRTESGGDPNAINRWDINAQRGDPSRGLMQVIGSTFAAYHVPGTSWNIYDPLANIAAAINYARHVYGPSLGALGSGHGYDQGGWLPPGITLAHNLTGKPELVLTHDQLSGLARGGDGGTQYVAHFDSLTGAAIESHVRTAFQAMSLTQGNLQRQGRRS